jgi:hypothetical protein
VDSECSSHVSGNRVLFLTYSPIHPGQRQVRVANNKLLDAAGIREVTIKVLRPGNNESNEVRVQSVLHIPDCKGNNLISVSHLGHAGLEVCFGTSKATVSQDGRCLAELTRVDGLNVIWSSTAIPVSLAVHGTFQGPDAID